ncbi:nicotinamide riboside transporter PnuC [Pedobacter yulinensis]|uniref:Nicotinamide riboside transporter PnuC n=1 Tax=Pedobacter yulinensis TaxID=2126353 RepID=A0A2T3HR21_9SPHI|nr:nicotinamide riboside transporter PnuC [Pedobacter yulinensis]PST84905.1 nicotinamide riboside transporter PnuC [Pedobacter yulinensis]
MHPAVVALNISEAFENFLFGTSLLEWAGVFTGILCVWLAARNIIWNWPIAIVSVIIYIFIFFETRLYADMGLQFYFLLMNIYGWYFWSRRRGNASAEQPITSMTNHEWLFCAGATVFFTFVLGTLLYRHTDASFPYLDSFCTAVSFVAQIFLARRAMQNWLIWIFVDLIYIGLYISKGLYPTAMMYALYVYIAARGYLEWKKIYLEQREQIN